MNRDTMKRARPGGGEASVSGDVGVVNGSVDRPARSGPGRPDPGRPDPGDAIEYGTRFLVKAPRPACAPGLSQAPHDTHEVAERRPETGSALTAEYAGPTARV